MAQNVEYCDTPYPTKAAEFCRQDTTLITSLPSGLTQEFTFAITALDTLVGDVKDRLRCVSAPEYDGPTECSEPLAAASDLREQLWRLHRVTGDLQAILSRVEA